MWQPSLDKFLSNYLPVENIQESTHQFSTHEIARMLNSHTGLEIDTNELYIALLDKGFSYNSYNLEMQWLFKEKQPE